MASRTGIETVEVLLTDLEDASHVLSACATYFAAQDVAQAQARFGTVRQSPIAAEIERIQARMDGIIGDYVLQRYRSERDEEEEPEEEPEQEELPANPLGVFVAPRQEGRRVDVPDHEIADDGDDEEFDVWDEGDFSPEV